MGCVPSERQRSSDLFSSDDGGSESGDRVSTRQVHEMRMGMGDHGGNERTGGIEWGRTDADKGCAFITPHRELNSHQLKSADSHNVYLRKIFEIL